MTTSDEQYVPSEKAVRRAYTHYYDPATIRCPDTEQEFDRFLARVRRDAAREALDGLAEDVRAEWDREHRWVASAVGAFRDNHYPEETL